MYAFALSCVFFTASRALAEPIPAVHDRLIRRCSNHTGISFPPYTYSAGPTGLLTTTTAISPSPIVATFLSSNTTAGAVGTSTANASESSNTYLTGASSTTSPPAGIGFPSSGLASGTQIVNNLTLVTVTVVESLSSWAFSASPSTCPGYGCTAFTLTSSSSTAPATASSSGVNATETLSSTSADTISVVPAFTSGSIGFPGSTLASGANITLTTLTVSAAITGTTTAIFQNITSTILPSTSSACTSYGYGCLPTYSNSTSSSSESTTVVKNGTSDAATEAAATTISILSPSGPGTITVNVTAPEKSPSSINGSWPTSSSSFNVSYWGIPSSAAATPTSAALTTTPSIVTGPASSNVSPISQSPASASASIPTYANTSLAVIWPEWIIPTAGAQSTGATPTTFATSVTSSNSTGASPTGGWGGSNSTDSLSEVEAEAEQLAGDSVGLIEKIDSLLAALGGKKRRASKRGV